MSARRVYLAGDIAELTELAAGRTATGSQAFAVTQRARGAQPGEDEESLEYDAFVYASRASVGRAVVIAVDLDERLVRDAADSHGYAVTLAEPVPLSAVVSIHVAEPNAHADEELLWYDVSELKELVANWQPGEGGHTLLNHS